MSKWMLALVVVSVVGCSKKKEDMPPSCIQALDCCSSLGRDLEDPELSSVRHACESAQRFADEGSDEKCALALYDMSTSFWKVYPTRSMGATCEKRR